MLARATRWMTAQVAFLVVLVLLFGAFLYLVLAPGRWGRMAGIVGIAVLLAGVLRAVLPTARVGMLAVRARWVDTVLYLVLGGLILGLDIRLHL